MDKVIPVLVSVLQLVSLALCISEKNVVTIAPTSQKPGGPVPEGIHTLSYYFNRPNASTSIFNTSYTTVKFLLGKHVVEGDHDKRFTVQDVSNIAWSGMSSNSGEQALIICYNELSFQFLQVINLTISNIEIINCGSTFLTHRFSENPASATLVEKVKASLVLVNSCHISITKIVIRNSVGYGLFAINLMGKSAIDSSIFINNNNPQKQKIVAVNNTVGGNAFILYSDNHPYSEFVQSYLSIKNSLFQNGSSNSYKLSFKCDKVNDYLNANGLGMIIGQRGYSLKCTFENVTFSQNKNEVHPSVLIIDNSTTVNQLKFSQCNFSKDGPMRIQKVIERMKTVHQYLVISNCIFENGTNTAIDICLLANPKHPVISSEYQRQEILIINCILSGFAAADNSIFQVKQVGLDQKCSPTIVRVKSCIFMHNNMSCSRFNLSTYGFYPYSLCSSIVIEKCLYKANYLLTNFVVFSKGSEFPLPVKFRNIYPGREVKYPYLLKFFDTHFIDNTLEGYSFSGIVGITEMFAGFYNCNFRNSVGTALQAKNSVVGVHGTNFFSNNIGTEGGAISLLESRLHLGINSTTIVDLNEAHYGAGIFASPIYSKVNDVSSPICSLSLPDYNSTDSILGLGIVFKFIQNNALFGGNSIFFGAFTQCYVPLFMIEGKIKSYQFLNTSLLQLFSTFPNSSSDISSLNTDLYPCTNSFNATMMKVSTFPGANFNISLKTKGEFPFTPAAVVSGRLCYNYQQLVADSDEHRCDQDYVNELRSGEQIVTHECSNVTYSVHSERKVVYLEIRISSLKSETPSLAVSVKKRNIYIMAEIHLLPCPIGYVITKKRSEKPYCECDEYLLKLGVVCDVNQGGKVLRSSRMWIGFHYSHPRNITVHKSCPFDYCEQDNEYISLSKTDEQCNFNRGKVLCGACQENLSLTLGTSNCKPCTNVHLLLLIPFTLAGVTLVVLLLKCNLTVSTGHINGIIFYANIVHVNKALFFSKQGNVYAILTTFISWLNLDLGIETCFFENMDTYSKVWLQFVFPVYLWVMIGLIVVVAHYSSRGGRLIGNNSVPVLATLFLLSYAKLLRTIISTVSFTFIEFQDGTYATVWLPDGNIEYLSSKHTGLFVVALLFLLGYIFPLTLLVTFAPCLQSKSDIWIFKWVNRLKPFIDAFQGPYGNRYRFWTGLMLILRVVLYIIYASNYDDDLSINLFCTIMVVGPVAMFCLVRLSVYEKRFVNLLEAVSLLNLVCLCAVTWLCSTTGYRNWYQIKQYVSCISATVSLLVFSLTGPYQLLKNHFTWSFGRKRRERMINEEPAEAQVSVKAPTSTLVELNECDQLQEPLLDSQ